MKKKIYLSYPKTRNLNSSVSKCNQFVELYFSLHENLLHVSYLTMNLVVSAIENCGLRTLYQHPGME